MEQSSKNKWQIHYWFLMIALSMLLIGLLMGILASLCYGFPSINRIINFTSLRPLHVSSVVFWILLAAQFNIYDVLNENNPFSASENRIVKVQIILWVIALVGIVICYLFKQFGGREYWEFNPVFAIPILISWILFIQLFFKKIKILQLQHQPVYVWMWFTGIIFFLFTFIENYLWVMPYFRKSFITDTTIQWKVNGSLVGSWNQLIYGLAFYLMEKISGNTKTAQSKIAFALYFLGLFNLMFNWAHHIYTLPTQAYVKHIGYIVSMTEWIFFIRIFLNWKHSVTQTQKYFNYFPYKFLFMADVWIMLNMFQAILMSIPAMNLYTHGTHITVAHAMGTTIGINTMILLGVCYYHLAPAMEKNNTKSRVRLNIMFWLLQVGLLFFWITLIIIGLKKGLWQMSTNPTSFSTFMQSLQGYFLLFVLFGTIVTIAIFHLVYFLIKILLNKSKHSQLLSV